MSEINDFVINARGLSKNPLGIIALFISLIYGFACLVLGFSASNLTHDERVPLIWFLIIFPVATLGAFVFLVINHHKKLYAPRDFRDDSGFLKAMGSVQQNEALDKKADELSAELKQLAKTATNIAGANVIATKPSENYIDVHNHAKSKYYLVENLVFAVLSAEYKAPIIRSVAGNRFYFDGMLEREDEVIAFEVKYTRVGRLSREVVLQKAVRHFEFVKGVFSPKKVRLVLVVVHEGENLKILNNDIEQIVAASQGQIEVRLFHLNELSKRLGME